MPDYQSSLAGQEIENRLLAVPDKAEQAVLLMVESMLSLQYDPTAEYYEGDFCIHGNKLYRCKSAASGQFVSGNWKRITVDEYLKMAESAKKGADAASQLIPEVYYEDEWDDLTEAQQSAIIAQHPTVYVLEGSRPSED